MSFSEWREVKLGDVVDTISNRHKFDKDEIILINTSDVLEGKVLNHEYVKNVNLKGQFKKSFQKNDILYSEIRPQNKRFAYIDFQSDDYIASTKLMVLRKKNETITTSFLYQILKSDDLIKELQVIAESRSGTFPQITYNELSRMKIKLPPLDEQKAIAHILSTLDDKIEVNNQINKTLENMAQAIFKQWFVDFEFPNEDGEPYKSSGGEMIESELGMIPKGWEVVLLEEVAEFQNGYAFKSKELLDEDQGDCFHVFKMGHIKKGGGLNKEGTKSYVPKTDYGNLSRYIVKKGDLLMCMTDMKSNVALLGHTALMDEDNKYILNQRVGLIRTLDKEKMNYPYLFILTNSKGFIENLRSRANSGVQVNLSTKEIKESLLVMPQKEILEKFNCITENIFEEYFNLGKENSFLTSLRDSLLPKLMSGEIRVPLDEEGDVS